MERTKITDHDAERSIDTLRSTFDAAAAAVDDLADALEDGDADEVAVAETYRRIAEAVVTIEDAAESAELIDAYSDKWRAVDESRKAMYHATQRLTADDATIAPTAESSRREALRAATAAAEYLDEGDR
jgi:ABC-type transporter Mla subunit MlaD